MTSLHAPRLGLVASFVAAVLLLSPVARAQDDHGEEAYDAWTSAFLVTRDVGDHAGMTFFAKALTGPDHNVPDDTWRLAFHIMVVEDTYLHTRDPAQLALINTLLSDYMVFNGTDFSWNQWNDDLAWISIAFIRGYEITGEQKFLDMSAHLWNLAYDRDWDTELGGGIWENREERPGKEALSNNPFVFSGLALYEATQDPEYLRKATEIYAWIRENLFDEATGQVHQGVNPPGTLSRGDNVYNSGTFIIAANDLYKVVGNESYREDAVKAIGFVLDKGPILHNSDNSQNSSWAYWFIKALTEFCNDHDAWDQYQEYLDNNAQSAWANRDPQTNLTGNDWTSVYTYSNTDQVGPMPSDSGVAIWQVIVPNVFAGTGGMGGAPGTGGTGASGTGGSGGLGGVGGTGGTGGSAGTGGTGGSIVSGGAGGSMGSSGGIGGSGSGGAFVEAGSSGMLAEGAAGASAPNSSASNDSGCGCRIVAKHHPGGFACAGSAALMLFAVSKRRRSLRSLPSRR